MGVELVLEALVANYVTDKNMALGIYFEPKSKYRQEHFDELVRLDSISDVQLAIRPVLFQNLADKLGGVRLSGGLLAILHPNKTELDTLADDFEPDSFEDQYRNRLKAIREEEWNASAFNFWLKECECRKTI